MSDAQQQKPRIFRRHRHLALSALVVVSALLSLVLGMLVMEVAIRGFYPITTLYYFAEGPDYLMEPGRSISFDKSEFHTTVETNSLGLRDDEPDAASDRRILLLGDSFVFGHGVEHEQTFEYLLEQKLNSRGTTFTVINAGHNGYDTRREYAYLAQRYGDFAPDTVILGFVLNDALSNSGDYFFSPIPLGAFRNFPLRSVQSLAEYLRKPRDLLAKLGFDVDAPSVDHFDCLRDNDRCRKGWEATLRYLAGISGLLEQRQVAFIVVNIPVADQIRYDDTRPAYDMHLASKRLQQFGVDLGFTVIDLAECEGLSQRSYYPEDGHWNPGGHSEAAACIYDEITQTPLLLPAVAPLP